MALIDENTVPGEGQLKNVPWLEFEDIHAKGLKVLFVGNSITRHRVKPEIGWHHCWGMAASAKEKDYVHLCMDKIHELLPDAVHGLCLAGEWELHWSTGTEVLPRFDDVRTFDPDIIVMRIVENCPRPVYEKELFVQQYDALIQYLNPKEKAFVAVTTGFWEHPASDAIRQVAKNRGYALCELEDMAKNPAMKAIGLFEHKGVAAHPGDLGMSVIAQRIFDTIEPAVKAYANK